MKESIKKNGLALAGFAALCTALVAVVNNLTAARILDQQQQVLMRTLDKVLPQNLYDNDLIATCTLVNDKARLGNNESQQVYRAYQGDKPAGAIIETTAPDGYSGSIQLMVGIDNTGLITGVQVLKHKETPGLGDKIDERKSHWLKSFIGKRVLNEGDKRWAVKKDNGMFDQFTGATITPRAVVKSVKNTALYFAENQATIFSLKANCTPVEGDSHE